MGLSQRVTELLERWLGEGECLPQTRPLVESLPTPSSGLSGTLSIVNVTTTAIEIVTANTSRRKLQIQNQGTVPVLIKIGGNPSITDYHFIITQASDVRIGDGGVFGTETSMLSVFGIVETGTADISVLEEVY